MQNNNGYMNYEQFEHNKKILKRMLIPFYSIFTIIIVFSIIWLIDYKNSQKLVFVERNVRIGSSETAAIAIINTRDIGVVWSSSNEKIAKVDENGNVTAVGIGKAKIIAKTLDNKNKATCYIEVIDDAILSKVDENDITDISEIQMDETNTDGINISVDDIVLSTSSIVLEAGKSTTISANVLPYNASNKEMSWTSSNINVARIDKNGVITAISPGEAIITVISKDNNLKKECHVKVLQQYSNSVIKVTNIELSKSSISLNEGESTLISVKILPNNASNKMIIWSSNDEKIAVVGADGKITALKEGKTVITARSLDGNISKKINVTVSEQKVAVTNLTLSKKNITIKENKQTSLSADVSPSNATNKTVIWKSTNSNVATIDQNGNITAKNSGVAKIIATTQDGSIKAECTVTVEKESGQELENINLNSLANCVKKENLITKSYTDNGSEVQLYSCLDNLILNSYQSMQNFAYTGDYLYLANSKQGAWTNQTYVSSRGYTEELKRISTNHIVRIGNSNPKVQYNYIEYAGHAQSFDVAKINGKDTIYLNYFPSLYISSITYKGEPAIGPKNRGFTWFDFINNSNQNGTLIIPNKSIAIGKNGSTSTIINSNNYKINGTVDKNSFYNKILSIACSEVYNTPDKYGICSSSEYLSGPEIGIDEKNDKVVFVSGKKVYIYSLSQIKNGNMSSLKRYDIELPSGATRQGVEIYNNYLYLWFGATGADPILVKYDLNNGKMVSKVTFKLDTYYTQNGKVNFEAEGMSIYNGKIYVGIVNRECTNLACTSTRTHNDIYQIIGM